MRWILLIPVLLLPASAQTLQAQGVMDLPDKAVVERFGDNQLLEFRPNPDGSPRDYLVYGLTRRGATPGVELRPVDRNSPVATAVQRVKLRTDRTETATVDYQLEQVAYLEITLEKWGIRDAGLFRNGQKVLWSSGSDYGNWLWGILWTTTFGLISLVWLPGGSATLTYTEAVSLDSPPIEFKFGGGGDCFAFNGNQLTFTVDPSRLQAGRVYPIGTRVFCDAPGDGIRVAAWLKTGTTRVEHQVLGLPGGTWWPNPYDLYMGNPIIAPGALVYNRLPSLSVKNPYFLNGATLPGGVADGYTSQVDSLWETKGSPVSGVDWFDRRVDRVYNQDSRSWYCLQGSTPARPYTLSPPPWGVVPSAVTTQTETAPDGSVAQRLSFSYTLPDQQVTLTDTFAPCP